MANKYVLKFTKDGYAKYTSHLDLLRFFKRAFRKSGIALSYSQGFNPHPKLGFAQPLSLGYASSCELLEFTTDIPYETESIYNMLKDMMPEGLTILWCKELGDDIKSLASIADYAVYDVVIPFEVTAERLAELKNGYLQQEEILAMKKQKKDKKQKNRKHISLYCYDLTKKAKEGNTDRVIGRDKEIERVIQILSRRSKNNPCLIGEPGVGKTAIAEGLALKITKGEVPEILLDKKIFALDLTAASSLAPATFGVSFFTGLFSATTLTTGFFSETFLSPVTFLTDVLTLFFTVSFLSSSARASAASSITAVQ